MSQVSMQQVKELRDRTQAGINDCKSALVESGGDMEKAVEIILKKGLAKSAKRAGAIAPEGVVTALVSQDGKSGVLVEVNIQTDFAARNAEFVDFAQALLARYPSTWHMTGQMLIELDGDRATGEIYFHAWHRRDAGEGLQDLQIAGRYLDRYERRDGRWAIVHRREVVDWTRTDPAADDWFDRTPAALRGGRGGSDPSDIMNGESHGPA